MGSNKAQVVQAKGGRFFSRPGRFIIISYCLILVPSTLVLMTKLASITGLPWIDALFTATSALTVTGVGVVDTGTHLSTLGHCWLLLLMQIGGLGQMTLSMLVMTLFGYKLSMHGRAIVCEELNQTLTVDVQKLIKSIVCFAILMECVGALILAYRWVPEMGLHKGIYYAIFHAVSAFNNAGFGLFASSLQQYYQDITIVITLALLFIIGGLGFTVVMDLWCFCSKLGRWRLSLHSKLVLNTSLVLLVMGTLMIYWLEHKNSYTIGNMSSADQWLNAFFASATTRTAGFSTFVVAEMTHAGLLVLMILMFIGAGSSSTGGGIKVSTFAIALIATRSFLQGKKTFTAFKRNISPDVVLKSLAIIVVSFIVLLTATFLLMVTQNARFDLVLFEAISAFSTVGLSTGLSEDLTGVGKIIMIVLMIVGRLGPLTLALALIPAKQTYIRYADEDVITG